MTINCCGWFNFNGTIYFMCIIPLVIRSIKQLFYVQKTEISVVFIFLILITMFPQRTVNEGQRNWIALRLKHILDPNVWFEPSLMKLLSVWCSFDSFIYEISVQISSVLYSIYILYFILDLVELFFINP